MPEVLLLAGVDLLIGIDDTDNESSPGTGWIAQRLGEDLAEAGLAVVHGATRHQLLVDPRVPYTSHNSSACLAVSRQPGVTPADVHDRAEQFLAAHSADGSDPGLAVAGIDEVERDPLVRFGKSAKVDLLDQPAAHDAARTAGCRLTGVGGTRDGVIGALAAVGLHLSGADGFFIWLPRIRELRAGWYSLAELRATLPVDDVRAVDGARPAGEQDIIEVAPWVRPLWAGSEVVLLLERTDSTRAGWRTASRELTRQF